MREYCKENYPIECPEDADAGDMDMCGARAPNGVWVCTRPRGHEGAHHAHRSSGECLAIWE